MSLDVLVLTDADDFETALPELESFAPDARRAQLTVHLDGEPEGADVAIVDARRNLAAAQAICQRLAGSNPTTAVVALVEPADCAAVDADWQFDDVMLPRPGAMELRARLRLAIGRRRNAIDGTLKFGDLLLHPADLTASLEGKGLDLTLTEFRLLNFLVQQAGRAFSRTRLMHEVWGYDCSGRVRTVDVHVRRLRTKLGPRHQWMIGTVRGVGYRAATPPQPEWIVTESTLTPGWSTPPPPPDPGGSGGPDPAGTQALSS